MEKYINEIIDIIENHPELNKQKIIEKFYKNTDRKFTTPELQSIYKKAKERYMNGQGKISEGTEKYANKGHTTEEIIEKAAEGKSQREIAKELGVTRAAVQYHLRKEKNINLNKTISNKDKLEKNYVLKIDNTNNITQDDIKNLSKAGIISNVEETEIKVYHPDHYNTTNYECWDVFKEIAEQNNMSPAESALFFNVFKYIWRYHSKDGIKDLEKAKNYIDELIKILGE